MSAQVAAAMAPAALVRRDFRHTKIVCTLGPASRSMGMIQRLAAAGMNVARLNMSHGDRQEHWLAIQPGLGFHRERALTMKRADIAKSACRLADAIGARAIVVITRRGLLAELVASFRPERAIIYAFSNMSATRRKLWLLRSVVPFVIDFSRDPEKTIRAAFEKLRRRNRLARLDPVVVVSKVDAGEESVTSIQVRVFQ
jgi:pyruvate kinase